MPRRKPTPDPDTPIRNHIRVLRFHADEMTQAELAKKVGVTRQTINAIEGGKYSPSLEAAFKIAAAFGKPLEEVFTYNPPGSEPNNHPDATNQNGAP